MEAQGGLAVTMANVPKRWLLPAFKSPGQLRCEFDDLFEQMLGRHGISPEPTDLAMPAIESYVDKDTLVIRVDLPGIDPKDVEISVVGNNLAIRGHRESKQEEKGRHYYHREVSYGSFERWVPLPEGIRADQIKASYKDGVLEMTASLPRQVGGRKVQIAIESEPTAKAESAAKKK